MRLPPRQLRPAFAQWRYERNLTTRETARLLEEIAARHGLQGFSCSQEWVRLICLPFGDAKRRVPQGDHLSAIAVLTEGDIGESDFYPEKPVLA